MKGKGEENTSFQIMLCATTISNSTAALGAWKEESGEPKHLNTSSPQSYEHGRKNTPPFLVRVLCYRITCTGLPPEWAQSRFWAVRPGLARTVHGLARAGPAQKARVRLGVFFLEAPWRKKPPNGSPARTPGSGLSGPGRKVSARLGPTRKVQAGPGWPTLVCHMEQKDTAHQ